MTYFPTEALFWSYYHHCFWYLIQFIFFMSEWPEFFIFIQIVTILRQKKWKGKKKIQVAKNFFCASGDWIHALMYCRQVLCHWVITVSPNSQETINKSGIVEVGYQKLLIVSKISWIFEALLITYITYVNVKVDI